MGARALKRTGHAGETGENREMRTGAVNEISLARKCHNAHQAEVDYGREAIARHRRAGTRPLEPTPPPSP